MIIIQYILGPKITKIIGVIEFIKLVKNTTCPIMSGICHKRDFGHTNTSYIQIFFFYYKNKLESEMRRH